MKPFHYQTLETQRVSRLVGAWQSQRPLRVLDYGCGRGKYLKMLAAIGCDVTGVDASPAYVEEGRGSGYRVLDPVAYAQCADRFDLILLSHLVEHLSPQELVLLIPQLCARLAPAGRLLIISPVLGERFYHDFSHVRPYYPQSIRHAFGQQDAPLQFGGKRMIKLVDIYFFRDPYRTRSWRSFYVARGFWGGAVRWLNRGFDWVWFASGGRIGALASWLGVYEAEERVGGEREK